jgi:hypothetical protein
VGHAARVRHHRRSAATPRTASRWPCRTARRPSPPSRTTK